jgi:hypothetical protein
MGFFVFGALNIQGKKDILAFGGRNNLREFLFGKLDGLIFGFMAVDFSWNHTFRAHAAGYRAATGGSNFGGQRYLFHFNTTPSFVP